MLFAANALSNRRRAFAAKSMLGERVAQLSPSKWLTSWPRSTWQHLKRSALARAWPAWQLQLLGTALDEEVAARIGRTVNAVRVRRTRLGIPNPGGRGWTVAELAPLGTAPDEEIAAQVGRTSAAVAQKRCKLGIPTFPLLALSMLGVAQARSWGGGADRAGGRGRAGAARGAGLLDGTAAAEGGEGGRRELSHPGYTLDEGEPACTTSQGEG
jgi:hypothetical protein